ncbi:MAG: signal peptidase II [Spirochaetaceae bacterium]|jgi:lipoprotein signal peptidase|nr:signal peptidase II [Spirochaetaceae bacterium]
MKCALKVSQPLLTCGRIFMCFSLPPLLIFLLLILGKELYYYGGSAEFWQRMPKIPEQIWFWCNFIPPVLLFFIGLLINHFIGTKKHISKSAIIRAAVILICADQTVQLLVNIYSKSIHITLVQGWLEIIPKSMVLEKGTYLSNAQKPVPVHLLSCFLGIVTGYFFVRFYCCFTQNRSLVITAATLYAAAFFCSIFDAIVYGYGYDYIEINPLYIFDIKDVYLLIGCSTFFLTFVQNRNSLKKVKFKDMREYCKWEIARCAAFFRKFFSDKRNRRRL